MARSPAGLLCPAESALGPFFEEEPMVQPSQRKNLAAVEPLVPCRPLPLRSYSRREFPRFSLARKKQKNIIMMHPTNTHQGAKGICSW